MKRASENRQYCYALLWRVRIEKRARVTITAKLVANMLEVAGVVIDDIVCTLHRFRDSLIFL